ncbi:Crp/Fnr family transcriptional regulator [Chitinophaga silvatica]|uniref:Crp/Fnr family transcriptional regulator n=1 Tax=Chitinophaga silvatica TaxID=2282649 RepID=A0A3E1Y6H4_9BACT|nr:Crp/Fnr family transcriptional regulator [Chitinophaga silvatica]RFS20529.1 Crp/Fnr family transcriptional regulator [Chitinophaga silvatica]
MVIDENLKQFFDFVALFYDLNAIDLQRVHNFLQYKKVSAGEVILEKGQRVKGIYFINNGVLKVSGKNEHGQEGVLYFISTNQFGTTPRSYYLNTASDETIIAACDSEIVLFPKRDLDAMVVGSPCFRELMNSILQQETIFRIDERKEMFKEKEISKAFKKFIIRYPEIAIKVSPKDMASFLCMSDYKYGNLKYLLV